MAQVKAKYLKDYRAPDFTITQVDLSFVLDGANTQVTAVSQVKRLNDAAHTLELDGEGLSVSQLLVDGKLHDYRVTEGQLSIETDLADFELTIVTKLDPEANLALEGLYMSDGAYCTQCEAEGFRRITYFLDRPDVLAIYKVRIEADKAAFPYLLSNGNRVDTGELDGGRHFVCWEDPFPKPAYLFALVAGDFDLLDDSFTTKSGRDRKSVV